MAQLKDDCFAHGGALTPLDVALLALEAKLVPVVGIETVPLAEALGRIAAADVVAGRPVPPHDNSAVDGYAVYFDDLNPGGDTRLAVTGRIAAGHPLGRPAKPGEALRIFTGAPMPDGPDTIFMQEDVTLDGDDVILPQGLKRGANHRSRGEDVTEGSVIIPAGKILRPQEIGLAASVGLAFLHVHKRLRVAVFSTGDEVRDPSGEAPDGCIFDSNRFTVMGLLEQLGAAITDLGILPDDENIIRAALEASSADHDLLFTSGGVSVGDEDHVKAAVESLGQLNFWRLAIKPGRPIALGTIGGAAFIGLPGNPVAAMVTFIRVARPVVLLLAGATDITPDLYRVRAGFSYDKKTGRREWVRCRLQRGGDGVLTAHKHSSGGAGVLSSMVWAHGLVELPEDRTHVDEGETVDFLPFNGVLS
ncbi:MAG: molybdopterin molybdotransferase MoeA [Rhodospirillaceae bacterium]|nr:molybdopterin molybdotransferase MoeA [Rhodospirillaceae bacterium]